MEVDYDASNPEVMRTFYQRLYPFKQLYTWLNHQHPPGKMFTHREFACTLPGDVYIRYNSFNTAEDLKRQVCKLNPSRFEIGAVYSARPRDKKTLRAGALVPLQRELVFDIDMSDYDGVRTCCVGKGICKRCWGFIACAVRVLNRALREDLGYRHLLWVYSGRRGIHCWVSDPEAMQLTDEQRKAVMGWLEVVKGGAGMSKKVDVYSSGNSHPSIDAALGMLSVPFTSLILEDQDCFSQDEQWNTLLELISEKAVALRLKKKWEKDPQRSSEDKWNDFRIVRKEIKDSSDTKSATLESNTKDIILQYTYPRLDSEVTKHRNHLLKAPFCVHPSTGRVCVPVDPELVEEFDPERVPTVGALMNELDILDPDDVGVKPEAGAPDAQSGTRSDWDKSSLKPYVEMLERHAVAIMNDTRRVKKEAAAVSMEF